MTPTSKIGYQPFVMQSKVVTQPVKVDNQSAEIAFKGKDNENEKSNTTKCALTGFAIAGAIGLAILAIKKGKVPKETFVDDFRNAGNKFVKGKAFNADGSAYTGLISSLKKDGSKVVRAYKNGVLQTAQTLKPTVNGQFLPSTMKQYNYNGNGKLESVTEKAWAHVSHMDPKKSGFQWLETKTKNLDEVRKVGLEKFKQKQAKQAEIRKIMNKFENASERNVDKYLDDLNSIGEFGVGQGYSDDYVKLKRQYAETERMQERIAQKTAESKAMVNKLEQQLDGRVSVNVSNKNDELDKLNTWYRELEKRTPEDVQKAVANAEKNIADDLERAFNKSVSENDSSTIGCIRASIEQKFKSAWTLYGQEFTPVNYTITIGGRKHHILYEGIDYLVTIDHKLIRKVRCNNKETKFVDVFESMTEKALKQLKEEEIAYAEKLRSVRENSFTNTLSNSQNIQTTRPRQVQVLHA